MQAIDLISYMEHSRKWNYRCPLEGSLWVLRGVGAFLLYYLWATNFYGEIFRASDTLSRSLADSGSEEMGGGEIVALILFAALAFGLMLLKEKRLADPNVSTMISVEQMSASHQLPKGPVAAALLRQSGNLYRELGGFSSADDALIEIKKAFRRAGIDSVAVMKNTPEKYQVLRLHHSHGGKAEGKKLGGAVIISS